MRHTLPAPMGRRGLFVSEQETPAIPAILQPGIGDYVATGQAQTAQQRSTAAQTRAATGDSELAALGAGTDPEFVTTLEHFEGWTHQAMYEAVHGTGGMDAAGLRTLQQVWQENYSDLVNLSTFNLLGLNRIFGEGLWTGDSADAAQAAAERYSAAANQIGRVFGSVANRLDALAWAAEALRAAVQPPPNTAVVQIDPDDPTHSVLPGLISPEYAERTRAAQEVARQETVRALNNIYKPTYPPAGSGVPTYVMVPQLGGDTPGAPAGTSPSAPGAPGAPTTAPVTTESETPPQQGPVAPGRENPLGFGPEQLGALEGLLPGAGEAPGADPAATTPAGVTPSSTTTPGGPGGPGLGTPSPGLNSPEQPGRTVNGPGGPGTSAVPPGATAAARPSGGAAPGRGSMMPAMPGAAGGNRRGEGDDEHSVPEYLRRVQDDWTAGLGSPVGVIGADPADEPLPAGRVPGSHPALYDDFGSAFRSAPTSAASLGAAGTQPPSRTVLPEPPLPDTHSPAPAPSSGAPDRVPGTGPIGQAPRSGSVYQAPDTSPGGRTPRTRPLHQAPSTGIPGETPGGGPAHRASRTGPVPRASGIDTPGRAPAGPVEQVPGNGGAGQEPPARNIPHPPPPAVPADGRSEPNPPADPVVFTATGSGPIMEERAAENSPTPEPEVFTVTGSGPIMDLENPGGAPPR